MSFGEAAQLLNMEPELIKTTLRKAIGHFNEATEV
jgi:predicted HTH domain antitoxin